MLDDPEKGELSFDESKLCNDGQATSRDGDDNGEKEAADPAGTPLSICGSRRSYGFDAEAQESLREVDEVLPPIRVARGRRRGLLGKYTLLAEVSEPKHYPNSTKWFITFVIAVAAMAAPMGSTILFRKESTSL